MTVVEVFADIVCPFTHVGLRRLVEQRRALGADFTLRVRAWPLELVNEAPLDAALVADKVAALRSSVAPDLFGGFDARRFPHTSLPALSVAAAAYRCGPEVGERASLTLRSALFEAGVDIARPCELRRLADALGVSPLDAEQAERAEQAELDVIDDWHEGQARGVVGSPHFFIGDRDYFCPALRIEHPHGGLQVSVDEEAFGAFLEDCIRGPEPALH